MLSCLYHSVGYILRDVERKTLPLGPITHILQAAYPHLEDADVRSKVSGNSLQPLQYEGSEVSLRRKKSCFTLAKCPGPPPP